MTATTPQYTVKIYDQLGNQLTTLDVRVPRSWILDDVGQCIFTIASTDPRCTEKNLRYGNLVYIQSAGLPDWVGVIDPPRGRNYGSITVTAYSAEYLLKIRALQNPLSLSGSIGSFYSRLIAEANAQGGTQVALAEIYLRDSGHVNNIGITQIFDEIQKMSTNYSQDFAFTAQILSSGKLSIQANWYRRLGITQTGFILTEDNSELVSSNGVEEQGPFYNQLQGIGNASTWDAKYRVTVKDTTSVNTYGPHESFVNVDSNTSSTVTDYANSKLHDNLIPPKIFVLSVDNRGGLWARLHLGDTIRIKYSWGAFYGFSNNIDVWVRITGMSVDEILGKMALTVQEVV